MNKNYQAPVKKKSKLGIALAIIAAFGLLLTSILPYLPYLIDAR